MTVTPFHVKKIAPLSDDLASRLLSAPTANESSRDIMFVN